MAKITVSTPCHFKDCKGVDYDCTVTLGTMARLEKADFSQIIGDKQISFIEPTEELFKELAENAGFMTAVLFVVVKDQIEDNIHIALETALGGDVSTEQKPEIIRMQHALENDDALAVWFLNRITGEVKDKMRRAFYEGLSDFFPAFRNLLLSMLQTREKAEAKIVKEMEKRIPNITEMSEKEFQKNLTPYLKEMDKAIGLSEVDGSKSMT